MLQLLAFLLLVVEPLGFAWYASGVVGRVVDRGALAVGFLLLRLVVTAIGMAAGLRLWREHDGGIRLAMIAVALGAAVTILTALLPALPTSRPPGLRGPIVAALLAYDAAWLVYLSRRARHGTTRG